MGMDPRGVNDGKAIDVLAGRVLRKGLLAWVKIISVGGLSSAVCLWQRVASFSRVGWVPG